MLINLIQFCLFLCVYTPVNAMFDYSIEKAHVRSMLFDKYSITDNDDYIPRINRPIIEPLSDLQLNRLTIITQHVQYLLNNTNIKENYNEIPYLKKRETNALTSYLMISDSFSKKDIPYLSCLSGNIYAHLTSFSTTNPLLSYKIGLFTQTLLDSNPIIDSSKKTSIILNALEHLDYAQKNNSWNNNTVETIQKLNEQLHTLLAITYKTKNDYVTSLQHIKLAWQHRLKYDNNEQVRNIVHILTCAQNDDPVLFAQHASLTQNILHFINSDDEYTTFDKKNSALLNSFASSSLCLQLLPYIEQTYKTTANINDDINYLVASAYFNKKNYDKACYYIDNLSQPLSNTTLLVKASMYAAAQKTLPNAELKTILKLFTNNEKPSTQQQNTIKALLPSCTDFFIQTKNYPLALKLINKLTQLETPSTVATIVFIYNITKHLNDTNNNPYAKQWIKELNTTQFYNKIEGPSHYNGDTNVKIMYLLTQKSSVPDYPTMMPYLTAAVNSNELSEKTVIEMKEACVIFYCDWAIQKHHDHNRSLDLFDKAIQYDNTGHACYKKAIFILENSDNKELIHHAVDLLEKNIQQNKPTKILSQYKLAQVYLHHNDNPQQIPILKQYIPLDIDKALTYLKDHNNDKTLLVILCTILTGTCRYIDGDKAEQYINFEEALQIINLLIDLYGNSVDRTTQRLYIYEKLEKTELELADIEYLLNAESSSSTNTLFKKDLFRRKLQLLMAGIPNDNAYRQALECFKSLQSYQKNGCINFNALPILQEQTRYFVENSIMTDYAIEWCYFAALSEMVNNNSSSITKEQKELADYLFSAAKIGDLNAQLIILIYCNAMDYCTSGTHHHEALRYTHKALMNPDSEEKKVKLTLLINSLRLSTEGGAALAYYMLCDYYKNNPQQLEDTMLLFSKAKIHYYHLDNNNEADMVYNICTSCKDVLDTYSNRAIQRQSKESLIDALGTFTLGSMYQYSDDIPILMAARVYLKVAQEILYDNFKVSLYTKTIELLTASTHYKQFLITLRNNEKTINLEQLHKSVQLRYLPAIHKIAELYIQQHTENGNQFSINLSEFFPLLKDNVLNSNPCDEKSLSLLEKCMKIEERIAKEKKIIDNAPESLRNKTVPVKSSNNNSATAALILATKNLAEQGSSKHANLVLKYAALQHQSEQSTDTVPKSSNTKEIMRNRRGQLQRKPKK